MSPLLGFAAVPPRFGAALDAGTPDVVAGAAGIPRCVLVAPPAAVGVDLVADAPHADVAVMLITTISHRERDTRPRARRDAQAALVDT
jgi:hypothetical protein